MANVQTYPLVNSGFRQHLSRDVRFNKYIPCLLSSQSCTAFVMVAGVVGYWRSMTLLSTTSLLKVPVLLQHARVEKALNLSGLWSKAR